MQIVYKMLRVSQQLQNISMGWSLEIMKDKFNVDKISVLL